MGSSTSKVARKYPKRPELPSQAARTVLEANHSEPVVPRSQLAESHRSKGTVRFYYNAFFFCHQ